MKRSLTTFIAAALLSLNFPAGASTVEFTYASGELFGYGQGMKENIDVAMCIDNPSLAGMSIKSIRAYLSGTEGFENTSIWLSKSLTLVDKANVPDIASYAVEPVSTPYGDGTIGMLSVDLPEPYLLTGQPVYIGYSLTVADNSTQEAKYPIVVSEGANPDGFFLHMSKSVLKWMDYSQKAKGVAYIVAVLEGEISDWSLAISGYKEANVTVGSDFDMELYVNNTGTKAVTDVTYSYSYDDSSDIVSGSVALPAPIEPDVTVSVPLTLNFKGVETIGPHILKLRIDEVDGNPNGSSSAYRECLVNIMPYSPVHRPLVEEFTGLWCGWCPRGWLGMEMLGEKFGDDVVIICYHNGDGMAVTNTYPVDFSGFPNAALNRRVILDPYYGTYDESFDFGISYDVENSMADLTMADIRVSARLEGSSVAVTSSTSFMKDIEGGNFRVGYVLVCDGLSKASWTQANYYAGLGEEYKGTYLEPLTEMPSKIPGITFNDVAVDVSGMNGVEGSLPSSIKTGEEYMHTYSFDIAGNALVGDPADLVVTAFVIDMTTGTVVNAGKFALADDSGAGRVIEDSGVVEARYYDLNGVAVGEDTRGIVIEKLIMGDGSFRTRKIINR